MSRVAPFFPEVSSPIAFSPRSRDPLSFAFYNPQRKIEVAGSQQSLRECLRFTVCYWHTMRGRGADPFGPGTAVRPWDDDSDSIENALRRVDAFFEFVEKLGATHYCFHDTDVAPEGSSISEFFENLDRVSDHMLAQQSSSGIKCLWGTNNLFSHPRYMHGAGNSSNADAFAYAVAQMRKGLEVSKKLGAENFVFWGGRVGYQNVFTTDIKRELDHLAYFYSLAVEHAEKIGFKGQFLIEPKPKEPTKHQYDYDVNAVLAFLHTYGAKYSLVEHFKINVEDNHATLAGHEFEHELEVASLAGALGSIDANRGDLLLGWDTDQFQTVIERTTKAMLVILKQGGIAPGGINFDAKVRRESFEPVDLFYGHIGSMDSWEVRNPSKKCSTGMREANAVA